MRIHLHIDMDTPCDSTLIEANVTLNLVEYVNQEISWSLIKQITALLSLRRIANNI